MIQYQLFPAIFKLSCKIKISIKSEESQQQQKINEDGPRNQFAILHYEKSNNDFQYQLLPVIFVHVPYEGIVLELNL